MFQEKPSTRKLLWQEAKTASRKRIVDAACHVFERYGYIRCSIEDVLVLAGVSRTTFYKHFTGKFELANAVNETLVDEAARIFFPASEALNHIMAAVTAMLARFRERPGLMRAFAELSAIEPDYSRHSMDRYAIMIEHLATRFPSFAKARRSGGTGEAHHLDACLLLRELERFCFDVTVYHVYDVDETVAVRVMAEHVRRFLLTG